jgi:hypothetical protein
MRIAICFHGQLRTAWHAAPAIKSYLGDLWENCDFFIHTWDVSSYTNPCNKFTDNVRILNDTTTDLNFNCDLVDKLVTADEIEFIQNFYQPKFFKIESYEKWAHQYSTIIKNMLPVYRPPFYYSFYSSVQGKKSFEDQNQFVYDVVVKLRPDVSFLTNKLSIYKDNKCHLSPTHINDVYTSYLCHDLINFYKDTTSFYGLSEILGISSSSIMDMFSNIWKDFKLDQGVLDFSLEHEYLTKCNIKVKDTHTINFAFHRAICQIVSSTDWPVIQVLSFLNDQVNSDITDLIDEDVKQRLNHHTKSKNFLDMLHQTYGK